MIFTIMLDISVFVVYSFFIDFFFFSVVSLKLPELRELIRHCFASQLCFSSVMENLRSKIKLNRLFTHYYVVNKNDSPERPTKAKKFVRSFQYETKYNITWFSQENLKNYKDVVTNNLQVRGVLFLL